MKPNERYQWIVDYLSDNPHPGNSVDVLDRHFVDAYTEACKPRVCLVMPYGANKVPQLGRDLSKMYDMGMLKRYIIGIDGLAGQGFPRWVYSYRLPKITKV